VRPRDRRTLRKLDPSVLSAAGWALLALARVRQQLGKTGVQQLNVPKPPPLPARARRGVVSALRRSRATCLMRAVILQKWDASHGDRRDLVIGVTAPSEGFRAHAWLEGEVPCHEEGFRELLRHPAR
jgi:transglutaminase superfamily protein